VIGKIGDPKDFLGIHICKDHGAGSVTADQKERTVALVAELGVSGKCRVVLMSPEVFGAPGVAGGTTGGAHAWADTLQYQRVVNSLLQQLHLAQCRRPDNALHVANAALAAYSSAPSTHHYSVLVDVVLYVGGTASQEMTY
jgi:hypothetical protein